MEVWLWEEFLEYLEAASLEDGKHTRLRVRSSGHALCRKGMTIAVTRIVEVIVYSLDTV